MRPPTELEEKGIEQALIEQHTGPLKNQELLYAKQYDKVVQTMNECAQEHLVDGNEIGAANDLHLIGCAERELKNYEKSIDAFKEARALFKQNKEVIHVARCDQKIASCLIELGEGELALETARKAVDVFETGHDHRRENFAQFEYGKAQILLEKFDDALATLEQVLSVVSEDEPKDFEFIQQNLCFAIFKLGEIFAAVVMPSFKDIYCTAGSFKG